MKGLEKPGLAKGLLACPAKGLLPLRETLMEKMEEMGGAFRNACQTCNIPIVFTAFGMHWLLIAFGLRLVPRFP